MSTPDPFDKAVEMLGYGIFDLYEGPWKELIEMATPEVKEEAEARWNKGTSWLQQSTLRPDRLYQSKLSVRQARLSY